MLFRPPVLSRQHRRQNDLPVVRFAFAGAAAVAPLAVPWTAVLSGPFNLAVPDVLRARNNEQGSVNKQSCTYTDRPLPVARGVRPLRITRARQEPAIQIEKPLKAQRPRTYTHPTRPIKLLGPPHAYPQPSPTGQTLWFTLRAAFMFLPGVDLGLP